MASSTGSLLEQLRHLFIKDGKPAIPGNVGEGRLVATICRRLMEDCGPVAYSELDGWDGREDPRAKTHGLEQKLAWLGVWEGAWALAQLHYDQHLKTEAATGARVHKGHPLCNLALLGQALGSHALTRHYALLSSAGDIYWKHKDQNLELGGLGPTVVERYESAGTHEEWRHQVGCYLGKWELSEPVYLEAVLAAGWFQEAGRADHVLKTTGDKPFDAAAVVGRGGKPFTEVLLDLVEPPLDQCSSQVTGTRFEAAAGLLLSATPGFEVREARKESDEQVDLVVRYAPDPLSRLVLDAGPGLVECKSSKDPVTSEELRNFGAKCLFHRVSFGILVALAGVTGGGGAPKEPTAAELVRRRFQLDGLTLLVLTIDDLRGKWKELRGLQDPLGADLDKLVFGPVG